MGVGIHIAFGPIGLPRVSQVLSYEDVEEIPKIPISLSRRIVGFGTLKN